MNKLIEQFNKSQLRNDLPEIRPGDIIKVYQKIKEGDKERIQVFEGIVIAKKHGKGISATITVRKVIDGIGVERIFPLHSPSIEKIEVVSHGKTRRAKLYYLRTATGKKSRLKKKELAYAYAIGENEPLEKSEEENSVSQELENSDQLLEKSTNPTDS